MESNKRTKVLAAVLIGLVGLWIVQKGLYRFVIDPITNKWDRIETLDRQIADAELESQMVERAKRTRNDYTKRSLPPDALVGQRLYRDWVHDLADAAGFDDLAVEAGRREQKFVGNIRRRNQKPLYTGVFVNVEGKTTFDRLCRFLYYFHRVNIPHRVSDISITSEGNEGNPLMKVKMSVEALSFSAAKARSRLFPETELKQELRSGDKQIQVVKAEGFPKKGPFHVRIGKKLLTVTGRKGDVWKVRPGIDPPPEVDDEDLPDAQPGAVVELTPITKAPTGVLADYRHSVFGKGKNPFVLPEPPVIYRPRLRLDDQTVVRGNRLRFRARASDLDPAKGTAKFKLVSGPKGMTIDATGGDIEWDPQKSDESKEYRIEVALFQGTAEKPLLAETARVRLVDPNERPTLEVPTKHSGFLGDPIAFQAKAKDPEGGRLRYSLSGAPEGARIDFDGRFTWTPSESLEAKDYAFDVVVTDDGRPAQSDRREVVITLKENAEKYTKLIAIISEAGKREAWMYDISTNTRTILHEGSQFKLAGLSGFLYVIGQDFVEFQTADGSSFRLSLGRFLTKRRKLVASLPLPAPKEAVTSAGKPK